MSVENQGHCNKKEGRTYRNKIKKKIKPQHQAVSSNGGSLQDSRAEETHTKKLGVNYGGIQCWGSGRPELWKPLRVRGPTRSDNPPPTPSPLHKALLVISSTNPCKNFHNPETRLASFERKEKQKEEMGLQQAFIISQPSVLLIQVYTFQFQLTVKLQTELRPLSSKTNF